MEGKKMKVEPVTLHGEELHDFFASLIVPRPIAFVSTVDEQGRYNAAPFSAFARLTLEPSVLVLVIGRRKGQKKGYRQKYRSHWRLRCQHGR